MADQDTTPLRNKLSKISPGAEYAPAPKARFQETVLVVPFHGGKIHQLQRHLDLLNELGFNAVTYDQIEGPFLVPQFMSSRAGFGFKHVWADRVENLLNAIPGQKIVFAMSNPASGAIEAIARRKAHDVRGLICDSGPTAQFWKSAVNYLTTEEPLPTRPLRYLAAGLSTILWTPDFKNALQDDLKKFRDGFPILSIRGWKDHLIPPQHIDMVFEEHPHLNWQKLSLPEGGHLNGLRDFAKEYTPAVRAFLEKIATPLSKKGDS